MSDQYSIDQDLREAKAMTDGLDRYVQADQLYGSVGSGGIFSGGTMPSLTVGALVMRLRRLKAQTTKLNDKQREQLTQIETKHDAVLKEWRYHYQKKMEWEVKSRLDAMTHFFEECNQDPKLCARVYSPEVLRRTIVEELLTAMADLSMEFDELKKKARNTDSKLRRYVQPASFVWASELEPVYPQDRFWWMYTRPPENQ